MTKDINKLIEPFRTSVRELLNLARAKGIPVYVTETLRSHARQRKLVAEGKSRTLNSKHLVGKAVDIAFMMDGKLSYDMKLYRKLYKIIENIPYIVWPYKDYGWNWDAPHMQYDKNKKLGYTDNMENKRIAELKKQVIRLHKEVRKLTGEVLECGDRFLEEVRRHNETLRKLKACEKEREKIAGEGLKARTLLDKIRDFFT